MLEQEVINVNLGPGEFYFGSGRVRVHTLLGSCVAITMWHARHRHGGMCHYVLPARGSGQAFGRGYYADDAVKMFADKAKQYDVRPGEYEVNMFGGGNMLEALSHTSMHMNVPHSNVESGPVLLRKYGFHVKSADIGGRSYRRIYFDLWNGGVWLKKG